MDGRTDGQTDGWMDVVGFYMPCNNSRQRELLCPPLQRLVLAVYKVH